VTEVVCPVTDQPILDSWQCANCKVGAWYGCPVKQEIQEAEAYYEAQETEK